MISVVLATRNRPKLCIRLIDLINSQTVLPKELLIVDSSNDENILNSTTIKKSKVKIRYIKSCIQSAAIQRNIALDNISVDTKYVVVLDDDVIINKNYIEVLIKHLQNNSVVGVSGIAYNSKKTKINNKIKILKNIFLLDSNKEGSITLGGVNVPITDHQKKELVQVEWLIGCSAWLFDAIKSTRYQKNFYGQSLFEDVIFSMQTAKKGKLVVDSSMIFDHEQSNLGRSNDLEFYKMWVFNRYFVILNMNGNFIKHFGFHWANFGKFIQLFFEFFTFKKNSLSKLKGFISGYQLLMRYIIKK